MGIDTILLTTIGIVLLWPITWRKVLGMALLICLIPLGPGIATEYLGADVGCGMSLALYPRTSIEQLPGCDTVIRRHRMSAPLSSGVIM